jgi:hypothetical protein
MTSPEYLGDDVRGDDRQLEELTRGGCGSSLTEAGAEGIERGGLYRTEGGDLVPWVGERGAHIRAPAASTP